jgi:hypothetical protein
MTRSTGQPTTRNNRKLSEARSIVRKLGFAGFTFFLVKGLLWLIVPGLLAAVL